MTDSLGQPAQPAWPVVPRRLPAGRWVAILIVGLAAGAIMGILTEVPYRLHYLLGPMHVRAHPPDIPFFGSLLGGVAGLAAAGAWCRIVLWRLRASWPAGQSALLAAAMVGPLAGMVPHLGMILVYDKAAAAGGYLLVGAVFGLLAALVAGGLAFFILPSALRPMKR